MTKFNRREFLRTMAGLTSGLLIPGSSYSFNTSLSRDSLGELLPLRKLGKTGEMVTMLGLGGSHIGWPSETVAREIIEAAVEGGIRFFDNAESYSDGIAEERYGKYLVPKYRDHIFLMTKTYSYDAETARQHLEGSLRRMKTDHLDLWQVHSLRSPDGVDRRIENGVLDVIAEAKRTGKTRYVGFTGHQDPAAHERMLDKTGENVFDTCQIPVNVVDAGVDASFINRVMPRLLDRNIAVLAMKTLANGRFFNKVIQKDRVRWETKKPLIPDVVSIEEALSFVWSLPVSVLITGAETAPMLREKIALAKSFIDMDEANKENLINKVAELPERASMEYYKKV